MPENSTQLAQITMDPSGGLPTIAPLDQPTQQNNRLDPTKAFDALDNLGVQEAAAQKAKQEAIKQNSIVLQTQQDAQDKIDSENLAAYDNLQRINQYGDISSILSLFDKRYSKAVQNTTILKNQLKSEQLKRHTETQINVNNAMPALLDSEAKIAQERFNLFKDTLDITNKSREIDQKDYAILNDTVRLRMGLREDERKDLEFKLKGMGPAQMAQALKDAQSGKGDWVGKEGFLIEELTNFDKAQTDLQNIKSIMAEREDAAKERAKKFPLEIQQLQNTLKLQGLSLEERTAKLPLELRNMESEAQIHEQDALTKAQENFISRQPIYELRDQINAAVNSGQGFLTYGQGQNQVQIPISIATKGLNDQIALRDTMGKNMLAEDVNQVNETIAQVTGSAAMMASTDKRAGRELTMLAQARNQTNKDDPAQVRQLGLLAKQVQDRLKGYAKENAAVYNSPEAKAAYEQAIATGQFSAEGADAIVGATAGNFAAATTAYHHNAYTIMNNKIAEQIKLQGFQEMPKFGTSTADAMALMAWAMRNSQAKEKLPEIQAQVLADPKLKAQMAQSIKGDIEIDALVTSMNNLARSPYPHSGLFKSLLENDDLWRDPKTGENSPEALLTYLEQRSVEGGPGVDYAKLLVDQLNAYSTNSRTSNSTSDPRYTVADRALEVALYGMEPRSSLSRDFADRMNRSMRRIKQEIEARKRADLSGQTSGQSLAIQGAVAGMIDKPLSPDEVDMARNPMSSTGANIDVNRVKELYGK